MQKVIERILNLLAFLLTVGRPVTADEIRNTVKGYDQPSDEAFRRTFERDKDLLRSLGVPVELRHTDIWEVELGYVVPSDDYAITDPGFTDDERSALLLASQALRFGGQVTDAAAIFKLGGAAAHSSGAAMTADLGDDLDTLGELFEAVTDRRRTSFMYKGRERRTEPYGLGHRFGHWYMLAIEIPDRETVKAFRVDRMKEISVGETSETFKRPEGFDPRESLPDLVHMQDREGSIARVRFDPQVSGVVKRQVDTAELVASSEESVTFDIPFNSNSSFIGWILEFDDNAVIESPPELVEALLLHLGVKP